MPVNLLGVPASGLSVAPLVMIRGCPMRFGRLFVMISRFGVRLRGARSLGFASRANAMPAAKDEVSA